jgi:hypothetical protein
MKTLPIPVSASDTARPAAGTVAVKLRGSSRMKVCAAQWQDLKKTGRTNGQTYRQFSSQCLKK